MKAPFAQLLVSGRAIDEKISRFLYCLYHDHVGSDALLIFLEYSGHGYIWLVPSLLSTSILLLSQPRQDEALELLVNFVGGLFMDLGWVAFLKPVVASPKPTIPREYEEARRPLISQQERHSDETGMQKGCCMSLHNLILRKYNHTSSSGSVWNLDRAWLHAHRTCWV